MATSHTEEAFLLASLKEFVRLWGSGSQASFHLQCRNRQVWYNLECRLGSPASPHFIPDVPVPGHVSGHHHQSRSKSSRRREKDNARAAAHRSRLANCNLRPPPTPPQLPPTQPPLPTAPVDDAPPPQALPDVSTLAPPVESTAASVVITPPSTSQPVESTCSLSSSPTQAPEAVAPTAQVSECPPPPELVSVFCVATFENCPDSQLSEDYGDSLRRYLTSEPHLSQNIARAEFQHLSSRSFRNNLFVHTVSVT